MAVITLNDPDSFTILSPAQAAPAIAAHVMQLQGWEADNDEARELVTAALALFAGHLCGLLVATMQARGPANTIAQLMAQLRRAAETASARTLSPRASTSRRPNAHPVAVLPAARHGSPEDAA